MGAGPLPSTIIRPDPYPAPAPARGRGLGLVIELVAPWLPASCSRLRALPLALAMDAAPAMARPRLWRTLGTGWQFVLGIFVLVHIDV